MKKVCVKCGSSKLYKHGKKRRKCSVCGKTCTIQSGRKKSKNMEMFLLDRSTNRRISKKEKVSHISIIKRVVKELNTLPRPIEYLKKTYSNVVIYF